MGTTNSEVLKGAIDADNYVVSNVADATDAQDAATTVYVDALEQE